MRLDSTYMSHGWPGHRENGKCFAENVETSISHWRKSLRSFRSEKRNLDNSILKIFYYSKLKDFLKIIIFFFLVY